MKKIAVLTSGGDAPGMNAAIRAVVRTGLVRGWEVYGIKNGYAGLLAGNFLNLGPRDVGGIMQRGGTMLGSARSLEFKTEAGQKKAIRNLNSMGIDGLIVIGGNGSQTGSYKLSELGVSVVGVASTIDNDLYGSDITIGVDTALNIALEAVDRLKITASSHQRAFLLEVMGRNCGYLALMTALAGGAEAVIIPEVPTQPEEIAKQIEEAYEKGKAHAIVIVAEGAEYNAEKLSNYFKDHQETIGFDLRVAILGHIQRGGTPSAYDRILASRLGSGAVEALSSGLHGVLTGWIQSKITYTPLTEVVANKKTLDKSLIELASVLD
ncbi:MAG: 6-phosphofructokinase [Anaerolineaceae bacterium]|jgi:6-phosphofructokinase 1|nr:6-phosphofructokinase [Anaerolineaceae bacterium]